MVANTAIPARPALDNSSCSCVWPEEYARQARVVQNYQNEQDKLDALQSPLTSLSAIPGRVANAVTNQMPGSLGGSTVPLDTPMPEMTSLSHALDEEKASPYDAALDITPKQDLSSEVLFDQARSPQASHSRETSSEAERRLSAKSSHIKKGYSEKSVTIAPARSLKRVFRFTCKPETSLSVRTG